MSRIKLIGLLICFVFFFLVGFGAGYIVFRPSQTMAPKITSDMIISGLRDRGFLISQTILLDTPVTIDKSSGNAFKDFFLGQKIEARATMEANLGVDLSRLQQSDVVVSDSAITITVPTTTLFNVRLVGPVEVKNSQGLLKRIIENDDGYNVALSALSNQAEQAAKQSEYMARATEAAKNEIQRMLSFVADGKQVLVTSSAP